MILAPEGDIDAACLPEEIRDYIAEVAASPLSQDELSPTGHQFLTLHELEEPTSTRCSPPAARTRPRPRTSWESIPRRCCAG